MKDRQISRRRPLAKPEPHRPRLQMGDQYRAAQVQSQIVRDQQQPRPETTEAVAKMLDAFD